MDLQIVQSFALNNAYIYSFLEIFMNFFFNFSFGLMTEKYHLNAVYSITFYIFTFFSSVWLVLVSDVIGNVFTEHDELTFCTSELIQFFADFSSQRSNSACTTLLSLLPCWADWGRIIGMLDPGARVQAVAAAVRVHESTNSDLSVVGGNLTGQKDWDEVLQPVQHSALQLFWQDNASSHTARVVQAFLNQEHI